jgi:hypothetical protein
MSTTADAVTAEKPAKREIVPKQVVVRQYGARLLGGVEAERLASEALFRQNQLWNSLVEVEHQSRAGYNRALTESDAELKQLQSDLTGLETELATLTTNRNRARVEARAKTSPAIKEIEAARKRVIAAMAATRTQIKARKTEVKDKAADQIAANESDRKAAVKVACAKHDLWWAQQELMLDRYKVARVRAMKEGEMLQFHRFDGSGSMRVRFSGADPVAVDRVLTGFSDLLAIEEPSADILGPMKARKADGSRRVVITVRVGKRTQDGFIPKLRFLVTLHAGHDMPKDMPLKTVTLRRDMHCGRQDWRISFMWAEPLPVAGDRAVHDRTLPADGCGIDFGWRLVGDEASPQARSLRVAMVCWNGRTFHQIALPPAWLARMNRADALRSKLDVLCNEAKLAVAPMVKTWGRDLGAPDDSLPRWHRLGIKLSRAETPRASLTLAFCLAVARETECPSPLCEVAERYIPLIRKLWLEEHHTRRKAVAFRKHFYREEAARIVRRAGILGVEQADLAELARRTKKDGSDNDMTDEVRRQRQLAAPSELRLAIINAAKREGRELVLVPAADTTRKCSSCGHLHKPVGSDLMFTCDGCSKVWDQDENAAANCFFGAIAELKPAIMTEA